MPYKSVNDLPEPSETISRPMPRRFTSKHSIMPGKSMLIRPNDGEILLRKRLHIALRGLL